MMKYCILALGTPVVDYFARSDEKLLAQHKLHKSASNFLPRAQTDAICNALGKRITYTYPGDNARNICEGVTYLGGKCAYAGSLANDFEGKLFSSNLRKLGIISLLKKLPGNSGKILTIITPDAARTFSVSLGNSEKYSGTPLPALKNSKFLYLASITALSKDKIGKAGAKLMQLAKKNKVPIAFSLESPPMIAANRKKLLALLEKAKPTILFANESEFAALKIAKKKFLLLSQITVIKKGRHGADIYCAGSLSRAQKARAGSPYSQKKRQASGCVHVPAQKAKVIDTTGAGDYFAAGFLYGFCKGMGLHECGKLGAKLAARAISRVGASVF